MLILLKNFPVIFPAVMMAAFFFISQVSALSIEEERKLGEVVYKEVSQQFEFVDDDFARSYIEGMGQHLALALETRHFPYRFYIINDSSLNAFATPGGHVFIFTGLIEIMDNADELAGVLSHELAHVSARHISRRIELGKKINAATLAGVLAGIFIGGQAGELLVAGSAAAGIQTQLKYSRNDERQADQLGFKYARASGFDTSGLLTILNKIQRYQLGGPGQIPPYLLTHPTGPERLSNLEIMNREAGPVVVNGTAEKYRAQFPYFKTILRSKYLDPEIGERLFSNILMDDPEDKLALFGLGLIYQKELRFTESVDYLQRALKQDPEDLPVLRSLGETYQMRGDHEQAVDILEKARRLDRQNDSTIFLLALSHLALENYYQAVQLLERLTYMEPVKNQIYYQLGIAYGRQERHARAHYYLGIYFKNEMRTSQANFHFNRARELAGGDQELIKQINKEMVK